jgi:hypothetical protein
MNRRQIFSISRHEDFGSKEDCIGYNGTDDLRTNLHKVILSAKVRLLAFHLASQLLLLLLYDIAVGLSANPLVQEREPQILSQVIGASKPTNATGGFC